MENSGATILLVEDDSAISKILIEKLKLEGFNVFHAENGEEGLKKALELKPHVILLDLVMPIMTGIEMLMRLRDDDWGKNAKVIILTNLTNDEKLEEAFKYGVFDYCVKSSWSLDDITEKVKSKIEEAI